ncbi:type IV pilus secretin PilQ family protein [Vibrio sp. ZSDZ34]|uniref:Type IV pilus secretin PilQ family protein n=1 Tax=Vibrio gelatinilyticus TaxID=2893468 RepID=A0A9X2AX96_9VIBR|nr:type IV pilus secretin PilQ family protein [Vibrio gelatinilyticus]MCJ2378789.1 type IV pilus secretin PilQ family protein [Vibrio gelatinilyticus]
MVAGIRCLAFVLAVTWAMTSIAAPLNPLKQFTFERDDNGYGVLVIEMQYPAEAVDFQKTDNGLFINVNNALVPEQQLAIFDVREYGTIVESIELFDESPNLRLFVDSKVKADYQQVTVDNVIRVTLLPLAQALSDEAKLMQREGKLTTVNFQDIPVRNVLQLVADYHDFNLVVSDSVQGNVTLRLDRVPWQQVLDLILKVKNLDKRVTGNVVLVAPKEELDRQYQLELEKERLAEEIGQLKSEIIAVNFAKASDVAAMIGGEGKVNMLSERGSISIDERTNALLVRDVTDNIDVIRSIVESLDIPVKQVQIEARIVTINEGNLDELGIRWGYNSTYGNNTVGGSIEGNLATIGVLGETATTEGNGGDEGGNDIGLDDFLNVNLAVTSSNAASIAFQVANLGANTLLDLELSALQQESKAEIISSPRLITTNKQSAYIEQGTEIPYLEAASSGATSVSFKKAVLSLTVTPQITPDNRLVLDLSVTQDRPGKVVKTGEGEAVAIDTQRIGTQVLVNNGETVVLGGIFQHSITNSVDKVPFLGDIPGLGVLFRRTYENIGKSELLIFVTPEIIIQ